MSLPPAPFTPPLKACDAHCHVFGPADKFPYSPQRKYTPEDAPKSSLFALHKKLGFERSVLVQASCHGTDNRAMLDMMADAGGCYRGVAIIDESFKRDDIARMHDAGVRGIRFNFLKRLVDTKPREHYLKLAELIATFGWHTVVYFESSDLTDYEDLLSSLPTALVIDHMGRPDVQLGIESESFQRVCQLLRGNPNNWVKVSCIERLSRKGPPYSDVIPYARYLVENFPDQVLWGTDWPHPNMGDKVPDDQLLVNSIPLMAQSEVLQQKLLVNNPQRLYEF